MTTTPTPPAPTAGEKSLIARLREDLAAARFTNDEVAQLLGADAVAALDREQIVPGQLRILELFAQAAGTQRPRPADQAGDRPATGSAPLSPRAGRAITARADAEQVDPCAVLTGLWLLALDVTAEQLDASLPQVRTEGLEQLNLVRSEVTPEGAFVRPQVDLRPYEAEQQEGTAHLWVTSDLSAHQMDGPLPADHVLGVGQASLTLASITHRPQVRRALDVGTGCGIQLFHLLDHAEHVVGTDLSERALDFTRFNLLLNTEALGLDPEDLGARVELLHGSLLEPVAGRSFDLVVSNPPFVITPRTEDESAEERYTYRDGGREGDTLMEELITGLPEILTAGGTAQMLGNWEIHRGTEGSGGWSERPRSWVLAAGLHAWFVQRDFQNPAGYAETWLRDASEERDLADYRRRYADYLQDFEDRGVAGVGFGMIWLQKPAPGAPASGSVEEPDGVDTSDGLWRRFEELTGEVQQPLGPVIGRTAERALSVREDAAAALEQILIAPEDVTEERYQRFGAQHPEVILARQGGGLRRARPVSSAAAGLLGAADGEFTASQLITAVASLIDAEEEPLREEILDLYVEGFLTHP